MKTSLMPYLYFNGQTKEAMQFYQSILGGELKLQTYGETGDTSENKDKIIHAELKTDLFVFYSSDGNPQYPVSMGNNIHMCFVGTDADSLTKSFNSLAEGGKVDMPLAKQFWGDTYGQLTDKFGIHWEVNIMSEEKNV
jgi:PhnB protein